VHARVCPSHQFLFFFMALALPALALQAP